ncbi:hypothetical protein [Gluconacetobacter azotocaptans]|uniref:hypothetical protein n=1 Tax=Gluconacetobacter azotocaptans TaxID=142834 RepID=UPI001C80A61A|nr:hypothetical protein [Gluconacetobacter azotocaptans]GBQ35921.1 hypothetical protein AA13594_3205 [Gluconacetobacter azotocaptans DSM 13594]
MTAVMNGVSAWTTKPPCPAGLPGGDKPSENPIFACLRDKRKHAKIAITAIMRKLIVLTNALLRDDRLWTSKSA